MSDSNAADARAHVLVAYATSEGQTEKVARRVAEELEAAGRGADLADLSDARPDAAEYDGVVVGASVHAGGFQRAVTRFAEAEREALSARPSAFFFLSLTAADDAEESREAVAELGAAMEAETGWHPDEVAAFAGALKYSEYGPLKRFVMKRIAKQYDGGTDTSRDYEYTDWEAVAAFAGRFADRLDAAAA